MFSPVHINANIVVDTSTSGCKFKNELLNKSYFFQFKEFNEKMTSIMPKAPKKEQVGRTEFEGFRDLFDYIISEDEKQKQKSNGSNS